MKLKTLPVFLAVIALATAILACVLGPARLSKAYTAQDPEGKNATSTFAPTDEIYIVADEYNGPKGTTIASKWYAVEVEGIDPDKLFYQGKATEPFDYSGRMFLSIPGRGRYLHSDGSSNWLPGKYRVELYLNDQMIQSLTFLVQ